MLIILRSFRFNSLFYNIRLCYCKVPEICKHWIKYPFLFFSSPIPLLLLSTVILYAFKCLYTHQIRHEGKDVELARERRKTVSPPGLGYIMMRISSRASWVTTILVSCSRTGSIANSLCLVLTRSAVGLTLSKETDNNKIEL